MNKYKILIFDLDDTLIDNLENIKHAFKLMIESKSEEYNEKDFIRWYKIDKKFWEDWQSDIGFAMKCNFDSCWFNKNNDKINEEYRPTMTINNLRELIEIL